MTQTLKVQPATTTHSTAHVTLPNGAEAQGTVVSFPQRQLLLHDPVIHRIQVRIQNLQKLVCQAASANKSLNQL